MTWMTIFRSDRVLASGQKTGCPVSGRWCGIRRAVAGALGLLLAAAACANTDPLSDLLTIPGSAGLGAMTRIERSPYLGGGTRYDLLPLYLYEGDRLFLHASRGGLKVFKNETQRVDVFLDRRFDGFPADRIPPSLAGMAPRVPSVDLGVSWRYRQPWGTVQAELLHDIEGASNGSELRLAYSFDWRSGRLALRPSVTLSARDAKLNDYYYGVAPSEALPGRPAYAPGAGIDTSLALYGSYDLSAGWRLLGGVSVTRLSRGVRASPIVQTRRLPGRVHRRRLRLRQPRKSLGRGPLAHICEAVAWRGGGRRLPPDPHHDAALRQSRQGQPDQRDGGADRQAFH